MQDADLDLIALEKPFWEPVGRFVIAFGTLEKQLDYCIETLLRVEMDQANALTSQIFNFRSKVRVVERLCHLTATDDATKDEISEIANEIFDLSSYRNGLVHGSWGSHHTPSSGEPFWQKLDTNPQNFKFRLFQVRLSDLETKTQNAESLQRRLCLILGKISKI